MSYEKQTDLFKSKVRDLLTKHEGYRNKLYKCTAGKWTIGVGHNIEDNGLPDSIIQSLLDYDVETIWNEMTNRMPWIEDSPEALKIVLIDMAFNMGVPRLMKFKNMLKCMTLEDWSGAYREMMDSRWAKQVGNRANNLGRIVLNLTNN